MVKDELIDANPKALGNFNSRVCATKKNLSCMPRPFKIGPLMGFAPNKSIKPISTRLNDFVGRSQEQSAVLDALQNTQGFVTLGAGGTGKTRLAQEIGRQTLRLGLAASGSSISRMPFYPSYL